MSAELSDRSVPKLARGVRLREDTVRGGWNLLAPERVLAANSVAVEVLKLCDGQRSFAEIVTALAQSFAAPPERIAADTGALLKDLAAKRMVDL